MKEQFSRAMDALHQACLFVAGASLVVITLIIPYGVFTRYVLNSAASWPEPTAVLLMIVLSFLSAVVCYREYRHIAIQIVPNMLGPTGKVVLGWIVELAVLGTNLFMLWFGLALVQVTWYQVIAELPAVSVGITYLPIPIGGAITALLVIERLISGRFFEEPPGEGAGSTTPAVSTE
jgi:TRAP-type C4-dicarboxylate transport system permease small subunit